MDMTCNFCGAGVNGTTNELVAWSELHDQECPGPKGKS